MEKPEYRIVYEEGNSLYATTERLMQKVNELQEEGWKVQGGVAISGEYHDYLIRYILVQAMIKGSNDKQQIEVIMN